MTKTFFCSDHHFSHKNILTFKNHEGLLIRDFRDIDHMHEAMIDFHNEVVSPSDRVYFLGDVSMNRKGIEFVKKMNGKKVLIKGNHDIFDLSDYTEVFEDVRSYKVYPQQGLVCSHIPLHAAQFEKGSRWVGNIHGHLHANLVRLPSIRNTEGQNYEIYTHHTNPVDTRYLNVSVEQINYTPIDFEEVLEYFNIGKNTNQYKKEY